MAVGMAQGADPAGNGGVWGVGGSGDGAAQAKAAFALWQGKGWGEFPAYRSRSYLLYVPIAVVAIATAGLGQVADVVTQPAQDAANAATAPFRGAVALADYVGTNEFWHRAVKIGVGTALMLIGMASIAWTAGMRPFFQAVGVLDEKIAAQADVATGARPEPVRIVKGSGRGAGLGS